MYPTTELKRECECACVDVRCAPKGICVCFFVLPWYVPNKRTSMDALVRSETKECVKGGVWSSLSTYHV